MEKTPAKSATAAELFWRDQLRQLAPEHPARPALGQPVASARAQASSSA